MIALDPLLDSAASGAREILIGTRRELAPIWGLVKEKAGAPGEIDSLDLGMTPWRDEAEKRILLASMQARIRTEKIDAYWFVVEAWASRYKAEDLPDPNNPPIMPREDPNRREVVVMVACNKAEKRFRAYDIVRDPEGRCVELKEQPREGNITGLMYRNMIGDMQVYQ
jgi:hypothetical protein